MAPSNETFRKIAEDAERDLNTYENKTGAHKISPSDEAGVDTRVENKFPGAEVRYGTEVNTNAGYNKRIPPEEGGDRDARGRQTRGEHFEGRGGPEHKIEEQRRDHGGLNEFDLGGPTALPGLVNPDEPPPDLRRGELMQKGKEAVESNLENDKFMPHKSRYPGSVYATDESVPAKLSAEGYEPPESVTEVSRESAISMREGKGTGK